VLALIAFAAGVIGLLVAANLVVAGSSQLGLRYGLTPAVVGLTIVAAGTSAPELAVVGQAVAVDDTELAVGGIIGSNIANILLVLGIVATIAAVRVDSRVVRIDVPIMIAASVLFFVFAVDNTIGRLESLVFLAGIVAFVTWTIRSTRAGVNGGRPALPEPPPRSTSRPAVLAAQLVVGIAGLALSARLVVTGAERIAASLGVPELIVGLTVVAVGTSAPEIITTIVAAWKGQAELAVGNAVGSNIFNILFVLGAVGTATSDGIAISAEAVALDLPVMVAAAVACLPILARRHLLERWEGLVFLGYYAAYVIFLGLDAAEHDAKDSFVLFFGWIVVPLTALTFATVAIRQFRPASRVRQT
jgi:cation:H+ antiporter